MKSKLIVITRCQDCAYRKQNKKRSDKIVKNKDKSKIIKVDKGKFIGFGFFCLLAKKEIIDIGSIPEWCPFPDNEIIQTPKLKKNNYKKND